MNRRRPLPVLKASSHKLFALLSCVRDHPYDRDSLREAALDLYPGRDEKSVFRGMVIPTLRRLGLIVGYERSIRLSANGALITTALDISRSEALRVLRAVLLEIDHATGHSLEELEQGGPTPARQFQETQAARIEGPSQRQSLERVRDWIAYLAYAGLVRPHDDYLEVDLDTLQWARTDLEPTSKNDFFGGYLLGGYRKLVRHQSGIRSIGIEDLRQEVAVSAYTGDSAIITGNQFDDLLRGMPNITTEYVITFGRSMGPEERLFVLGGRYYETISIRFSEE